MPGPSLRMSIIFLIILTTTFVLGCEDRRELSGTTHPPGKAADPQPSDGSTDVAPTAILSWEAGENSYIFHIYLGTDETAVTNANGTSPEFLGGRGSTHFDPPGELDLGTTYYWRVDSANKGAVTKGDVWQFTTVFPPPGPTADFTATPTTGQTPLAVSFTDTSTGLITSWSWDLNGDGNPDSTTRNPSCTYYSAGTYTVSLTVTGPGGTDTRTRTDYITVTEPPPVADFTADPTSGTAPLTVQFTDQSTGTINQWYWDFNNDGLVDSTARNPQAVYISDGPYSVKLTVIGPTGSDSLTRTDYIWVGSLPPPAPVAGFSATPLSGDFPLAVSFTDESTGIISSWSWTFGDGGTSTAQNPDYEYSDPGSYTVSLTVTGPGGSDTETKTNYITVTVPLPPPMADFVGSPTSGTSPLTVSFTDLSIGDVTSWSWDFGDGGTSDETNPSHTYTTTGTFSVSLTVDGPGGSDGVVKLNYITVNPGPLPPIANFSGTPTSGVAPLTVNFTDLSTGSITLWQWDFNEDGLPDSTTQNASHVFETPGTYDVGLRVIGPGGEDIEVKLNYITVTSVPAPVAGFSGTPTSGVAPLEVSFTDESTGDIDTWAWDFDGFGVDSTVQNPTFIFNLPGAYDVKLTVSGSGGSDYVTKYNYIYVNWPAPEAGFIASPTEGLKPLVVSFTSTSTGNITTYEWDFNEDGLVDSYAQNATYTYDAEGTYDISLRVVGPGGEDTEVKLNYITVTCLPVVTGISPSPDEVLSSEPSEILVTFNKEIDAATVNATNFKLLASGGDGTFDDGNEVPVTLNSVTLFTTNVVKMDLFGASLPDDTYRVTIMGEKSGYALSFDGSDDYVPVGNSSMPKNNAPQSICFWYFVSSNTTGRECIVALIGSGSSSVQVGFIDSEFMVWKYFIGKLARTGIPPEGKWHHVAYTYDGTDHKLYFNGEYAAGSTTSPDTAYPSSVEFGRTKGWGEHYQGLLDDVSIWTVPLTQAQIRDVMNKPLTGSETGLSGYWNLDEGAGQTVHDLSPNGNDGTLGANSTVNTDDPQWVDSTAPIADGVKDTDGLVLDGEFSGTFPSGNGTEGGDFNSIFYIGDMPAPDFSGVPTSGIAPLEVAFTDNSSGIIDTWEWDFDNNGTVDSTVQHPTHIYDNPGLYSVKLTVTGPVGSNSTVKNGYISVSTAAVNVIYVDGTGGSDSNDGLTWPTAVKSIQEGLNKATSGWTVLVADGTYTGTSNRNLDFVGKSVHLQSCGGADQCIIDCQNSGRGFYFHSGEGTDSIVEGFNIRNGNVVGSRGGGILCESSSPTIDTCIVNNCRCDVVADGAGGGILCDNSSAVIINCTISGNWANDEGGGICCFYATPLIASCLIFDNTSTFVGGGIQCFRSNATIADCTIVGNTADYGGALNCYDSDPTVSNTILWGNQAGGTGDQIWTQDSGSLVTLNNCDYENGAGDVAGNGTVTPTDCITLNPQFVNATSDNYRLTEISPCINAGSNALVPPGITTDLDGNDRIIGDTVDMGCYEFVLSTYSATSFDTDSTIDDNNQKVIIEFGAAKLAPEGDEFGVTLDTTHWTEITGTDLATGWQSKNGASISEGSGKLNFTKGTATPWGIGIMRNSTLKDADIAAVWDPTGTPSTSLGQPVILGLWCSQDNWVYVYYFPSHDSSYSRYHLKANKYINGTKTHLYDNSIGEQSHVELRIKRIAATNTFTFYYRTSPANNWTQVWSGIITHSTYFPDNCDLNPVLYTSGDGTNPATWDCAIDSYYQNRTDGIPAQRFWDDSPECGVVDSGAADYAFDAGVGNSWELDEASCVKSEPGTSSVLFKVGYSDTGNDADVTWVDAAWQTISQVDSNAAAGNYDGHRYIHVKAQFNSDGTDQPSLSSFSVTGRRVP